MGTKYAHADFLDNGIAYLKANANKMLLINNYTALDSYATVTAAKLAEATMASGDYTITGSDGASRVLTTAAKTATASGNSSSPDLHIAFVDTVNSKVLLVTDETSDQAVTSGNSVDFPAITYTSGQPT